MDRRDKNRQNGTAKNQAAASRRRLHGLYKKDNPYEQKKEAGR